MIFLTFFFTRFPSSILRDTYVSRYVVPSSKHHEGFTLFPSNFSWNWNSKDVGANRDLIGDLRSSFINIAPEIHFGLYFSMFEWFNPIYIKDRETGFQSQEFVQVMFAINFFAGSILQTSESQQSAGK